MFKQMKKQNEKFDLYKLCNCSQKQHDKHNHAKKKAGSYDAIKESITQEIPADKYRK